MRFFFASCLALLLSLQAAGQELKGIFEAISRQETSSIIGDLDSLISLPSTDEARAAVAGAAFDYFSNSPIMGHDAVAVHVADSYFLNGRFPWSDEDTYPALYAYAHFNRASLIGCDVPSLVAESIDGRMLSLRDDAGQYKLLYFYDPQCATCREYSSGIADYLRDYGGGRISVFAVNTGSDRRMWEEYVSSHFSDINAWKVDFYNVWDPDDENDYHRKFGVITTPALLLVDSQNRIVGRHLDPEALETLLGYENGHSRSIKKLLGEIFSSLAPVDTAVISQVASSLAVRASSDSTIWRDTFYEMFNYLRDNPNYSYQQGAAMVARRYILDNPQYWSEEYLAKVRHALDMFSLNPLGAKAPDLTLRDTSFRAVRMLAGRSKYTLLVFHIVNCGDCRREFEVLEREALNLKRSRVRVVCVYAGKDTALWRGFVSSHNREWHYYCDTERTSAMGEKYDISFVPKLYLLDRRGRIIAKEFDAETLSAMKL